MRKLLILLALCLIVVVVNASPALSDYDNVTSFTINITPSMGAQTNYPIKINLTNSTGNSGYINGETVIFTNGTTRPDFYDINLTDTIDTPLPFWLENNTCTAIGCSLWVRTPTIAIDNTSGLKIGYGYSSQSVSTMDGLNTFSLWDDFNGASINATKWGNSGTSTQSNGRVIATGNGGYIVSLSQYGYNHTLMSYGNLSVASTYLGIHEWVSVLSGVSSNNNGILSNYPSSGSKTYTYNTIDAGVSNTASEFVGVSSTNVYHRYESQRNATATSYKVDNSNWIIQTTRLISGNANVSVYSLSASNYCDAYWVAVRKSLLVEPTTSLFSTTSGGGPVAPIASFTCTPTSTTLGTPISCTDASTNSPTNWTYYWGDGNVTDGTQNPSYTYPFTGTFSINQTVNNTIGSSWYNRSNYITITNITSFTQQDIYLAGQYTITFNVKSSTTNLPIANVTVVDSVSGQSYPSTNGTAFLTEPAGLIYVNFIADGYQTKQVTYVVDQDETHEVKLVPGTTPTGGSQSVWYTPWQVRIRIVDYYGAPLPNTNVTGNYIASTLPSTDPTWLVGAFGVSEAVAADMLNSSMAMTGTTDDNGGLAFTMFKSIQYRLTITNTTSGVASTKTLYPSDQEYVIYVRTAGQVAVNNMLGGVVNSSLPFYKLNTTHYNLSVIYHDTSGYTTDVVFNVRDWTGGNNVVYTKDLGNPGTSIVTDNYTVAIPLGQEYIWEYNATKV